MWDRLQIVYKNVDSVNIVAESVAELHLFVINWRVPARVAAGNGVVDLSLTLSARLRKHQNQPLYRGSTARVKHYLAHCCILHY